MTQVFAIEMAQHKINVNCYAPGIVRTSTWERMDEKLSKIEGRPKGETAEKYGKELSAMGRAGVAEDVAKVVGGFLCSSGADYLTGQAIGIDGGIVFS